MLRDVSLETEFQLSGRHVPYGMDWYACCNHGISQCTDISMIKADTPESGVPGVVMAGEIRRVL